MIFENAKTYTRQGDIGEARAIYEYTKMGFVVLRTIFDSAKYDLVIDDGTTLKRVQVKTSYNQKASGGFEVNLKTTGGNTKVNTIRPREEEDYDIVFVLTSDNRCWSIPVEHLNGVKHSVVVGGTKYGEYELV